MTGKTTKTMIFIAILIALSACALFHNGEPAFAGSDGIKELSKQLQNPSADPFDYSSKQLRKKAEKKSYPVALDLRHMGPDTDGDGKGHPGTESL